MNGRYILDADGNPVPEPDLVTWAQWLETHDRHVAEDWVGNLRVSTIFLGLDHSFSSGPPVLWETMIFVQCPDCDEARRHAYSDATTPGFFYPRCEKHREANGQFDHYQQRYTSREDALAGHQEALRLVRQAAAEVKEEVQREAGRGGGI